MTDDVISLILHSHRVVDQTYEVSDFYASADEVAGGIMFSGCPSIRPCFCLSVLLSVRDRILLPR